MDFKNFFLFIVIFSICISLTTVSAIDDSNTLDNQIGEINLENNDNILSSDLQSMSSEDSSSDAVLNSDSEDSSYTIYIGSNITENGNGSSENPYVNFNFACDDVKNGKDNVIINVYDGEYSIDSYLIFNTTNLTINGLGDNVLITDSKEGTSQSEGGFKLSNSGLFTLSNVIISPKAPSADSKFNIFSGATDLATFKNCIFYNKDTSTKNGFQYGNNTLAGQKPIYNYKYMSCSFINSDFRGAVRSSNATFENCYVNVFTLSIVTTPSTLKKKSVDTFGGNLTFNDCFIGQIQSYNTNQMNYFNQFVHINRNVLLEVDSNYLGNNSFEIIGNLVWDDGSSEGIENLPVNSYVNEYLNVNIKSLAPIYCAVYKTDQSHEIDHNEYKYGNKEDIQSTAFFIEGSFKVNYTSGSHFDNNTLYTPQAEQIHVCDDFDVYIELTMGNQKKVIKYNFTYINLTTFDVNYGGNQNIIINFQEPQNGVIFVEFNNKKYNLTLDQNKTLNYSIPDVLPVGTYNISVSFIDDEAKIYGFNTTNITISKVSDYEFDATVTPNNLYVGENATVTLNLPDGATGTVTVKVGENEAKTFNTNDNIIIDGFVEGDNLVNITFNSDNYDTKSVVKTVVVSIKPTDLTATDVSTTFNVTKNLVITLASNGKVLANKTIHVVVGTIDEYLTTNDDGQVSIDISFLNPDNYTANITFAGDEIYNKSSTTAKVTVKEEIKTNITIPEIVAGKATTTTIKLPENATGNITVSIDGNISSVENLNNGSATVTIPELTAGKHNVTISYSGDDNYAGFAQTSTVEVKEPAKTNPPTDQKTVTAKKTVTKIVAKKKTFKAKKKVKKYTITLKAGKKPVKKVQVTLKIGKKTYKAKTNAKGKATFKIKKLTKKGKYTAKIKFKGNKLYKASSKKVKITIKK